MTSSWYIILWTVSPTYKDCADISDKYKGEKDFKGHMAQMSKAPVSYQIVDFSWSKLQACVVGNNK